MLEVGVSQISGASRTSVGGYAEEEEEDSAQFEVSDNRTLDQVINWLLTDGYIPSFCTACYRAGRTGDRFMSLAKTGEISNCCQPNALLTSGNTWTTTLLRKPGRKAWKPSKGTEPHPQPAGKSTCKAYLQKIDGGERDFRF